MEKCYIECLLWVKRLQSFSKEKIRMSHIVTTHFGFQVWDFRKLSPGVIARMEHGVDGELYIAIKVGENVGTF